MQMQLKHSLVPNFGKTYFVKITNQNGLMKEFVKWSLYKSNSANKR